MKDHPPEGLSMPQVTSVTQVTQVTPIIRMPMLLPGVMGIPPKGERDRISRSLRGSL
jgi:hypothetical protein